MIKAKWKETGPVLGWLSINGQGRQRDGSHGWGKENLRPLTRLYQQMAGKSWIAKRWKKEVSFSNIKILYNLDKKIQKLEIRKKFRT